MSWKMLFTASYDRLLIPSAGKSFQNKIPQAPNVATQPVLRVVR